MKLIISFLCLSILFIGCQPAADNSVNEAFEKNSKTVTTYLEGFKNESVDYSVFSDDFVWGPTEIGSPDSLTAKDMMESDKANWAMYDFDLLGELSLLPGVNADTKMTDGSVRYYGDWEVTLQATDSTEAKSGILRLYQSFDFNDEGKIIFLQYYGDVGGLVNHLHGQE